MRTGFLRAGFALAAVFFLAAALRGFAAVFARRFAAARVFLVRLPARAAALPRFAVFFAGRLAFFCPVRFDLDFDPMRAIKPPVSIRGDFIALRVAAATVS